MGSNCLKLGVNDLATKIPELVAQWDWEKNAPLTPSNVAHQSRRKIWWRCTLGHSWESSINARANGNGCPICAGRQVLVGFNDLSSQSPQLATEWDNDKNGELTPQMVTRSSKRSVWWLCTLGHS